MGLFDRANQIAVLSGGQEADWQDQPGVVAVALNGGNGVPTGVSDGVALGGALKALVIFDPRLDNAARRVNLAVATIDITETYRVVIDGNVVDYDALADAAANLQDILEGLRDEVNNDVTVGALVTASVTDDDGDGIDDTVLLVGKTPAHYTLDHSPHAGGAILGDLASVAEPDVADLTVWAQAGGKTRPAKPGGWRPIPGGFFPGIGEDGFAERFDTASVARLYVQYESLGGTGDDVLITYKPSTVVVAPTKLP